MELAKKVILSKVNMQMNLLKAYDQEGVLDNDDFEKINGYIKELKKAESIQILIGYEGRIAKSYFYLLNIILTNREFCFRGRSKNPAKDPFNTLLNIGYNLLYCYIRGALKKHGLNMGIGFLHTNRTNHASLASDLMEEWRPIIVDDVVMQMVESKIFSIHDFSRSSEGLLLLNLSKRRLFQENIRNRMLEKHEYIRESKNTYSFQYTLEMQIESLIRVIDNDDMDELICLNGEINNEII